jgi:hypothetical protein
MSHHSQIHSSAVVGHILRKPDCSTVPTPRCPNCSGLMVLSHKFHATPEGPRMRHYHCRICKIGVTQVDDEDVL